MELLTSATIKRHQNVRWNPRLTSCSPNWIWTTGKFAAASLWWCGISLWFRDASRRRLRLCRSGTGACWRDHILLCGIELLGRLGGTSNKLFFEAMNVHGLIHFFTLLAKVFWYQQIARIVEVPDVPLPNRPLRLADRKGVRDLPPEIWPVPSRDTSLTIERTYTSWILSRCSLTPPTIRSPQQTKMVYLQVNKNLVQM